MNGRVRRSRQIELNQKDAPRPGIEPGPPGWKPGILTPRPSGTCWKGVLGTVYFFWMAGSRFITDFTVQESEKQKFLTWFPMCEQIGLLAIIPSFRVEVSAASSHGHPIYFLACACIRFYVHFRWSKYRKVSGP